MTDEELAAIKARAEAATPGPWDAHAANPKRVWGGYAIYSAAEGLNLVTTPVVIEAYVPQLTADSDLTGVLREQDALFIASARTDIPALLAEVEAWRVIGREVAEYKAAVVSIYDQDTYSQCPFCDEATELKPAFPGSRWDLVASERDHHTADCPVAKARALLGKE